LFGFAEIADYSFVSILLIVPPFRGGVILILIMFYLLYRTLTQLMTCVPV